MAPWQVLRAKGALRTTRDRTLGRSVAGAAAASNHGSMGPYAPVHYAADAAGGSARTFSLLPADNKMSMQELNRRLALYMDEIQALEAANETLQMQIIELLDRRASSCDLVDLDRHLAIVNELHAQITDCQTAEAQTKLQLISLELEANALSGRLDAERGQKVQLEAYLRELQLTEEQLRGDTLPGLTRLVSSYTRERTELQAQHLQDVKDLRAQVSGEISMHLECDESSILSQQLEMFRDESLKAMIDKNQAQNNNWFNAQASRLTCNEEATLPSSSPEVFQTQLSQLRMTKLMLEEELIKFQTQQTMLEEHDLSLMAGYRVQLAHLQQTTDTLELQLSGVLQATSQQAEEYQALLHIKSGLEREIEHYTVLLDINHDRTLSPSYQTPPLNVQTGGSAFQCTSMMDLNNRVLAQSGTLGLRSDLKAQESCVDMLIGHHTSPVDPTPALHSPESTSTQTSIQSHQVNLAKDAPRKYPPSVTSINAMGLLDQSLTSSENRIQSITNESKSTLTGSQVCESKIAGLKMEKQSILLESQVQSQESPIQNSVIVEARKVQEITGTALDWQRTKEATKTITEISVQNMNIHHTVTEAAQTETHTISDSFIPMATAIESKQQNENATAPQLSSTSCDMQMSERSGIESNVCQNISLRLKATVPTWTANTDVVEELTGVDLNVSQAQVVTSIEGPTGEEIVQGNALDIHKKCKSVEITAVGNNLEKAFQASTDGDALGQAQSSVDDAVRIVEDAMFQMESNTFSKECPEDTSDQVEGTTVKLQTVARIEDASSNVEGIEAGGIHHSSVVNKADELVPLLASALRIEEDTDDVEHRTLRSHIFSDAICSVNHTSILENSTITAITDACTIIEHRDKAVKIDNAVPQAQSIAFVEKSLIQKVERSLSTHYALMEAKTVEEEEEGKETGTLHAIDIMLPRIEHRDQNHENVFYPNHETDVTAVVEVNQTNQETPEIVIETETGMTSVDTVVGCDVVTEVNLCQNHPGLNLSAEDPEVCLSLEKNQLSQIGPHSGSSQNEPGPVDTNESLNQNPLETCLSPVEPFLNPNDLDLCLSPTDQDILNEKELEACMSPVEPFLNPNDLDLCLSPTDEDILNEKELEACMSPVESFLNPNYLDLCLSPTDEDILNEKALEACMSPVEPFLNPNDLELCLSPANQDILNQNELEDCMSPVDNDIMSPNELESCMSPDTNEAVDIGRKECFSPPDDVCMSPTEEAICSPDRRYILSTNVDQQSLSFSRNQSLLGKDSAPKLSDPLKDGYNFSRAQSLSNMYIWKTDTGIRDVAKSSEGQYRNKNIEVIGQEAQVESPAESTYRKLSFGDREDSRFHSISHRAWALSPSKSLDGQKKVELTDTSLSPGSSLTNDTPHCFRSIPFTRGASFNSMASNTDGSKGHTDSNTGHTLGGATKGMHTISGGQTMLAAGNRATSPGGRLFGGGSGEWKVYGGSMGHTSDAGSASAGSVGSGGRLARSGSGDRISRAESSHVASSRRYGSMGSGESKPVYSTASGRISGAPGSNRAPSPGVKLGSSSSSAGRLSGGSGGRISSAYGGSRMSSVGSGGKHSHSGSNDRLSSSQVLRISSTAGQVRTNSTGGRVISSSDRPAGSVGSGVGTSKERISVCKRAALSISAAGRERSQEKHMSPQRMANNPRIQHWVTTGVGGTVEGLDDQDDILNL